MYCTHTIITCGLHTFYSSFEDQIHLFKNFYHKFLTLCVVSIQERVMIVPVQY